MSSFPRRSPRVTCTLPAHWKRHRQRITGDVLVCNEHGMFIQTEHEADIGYLIDVTVEMPSGPISFTAVPRYVGDAGDGRGHGIGVEVHVMEYGDRARWSAHYRRQLARARPR
jgi:hypothetical protein